MARIRQIKPGFFDNEHLGKCSLEAHFLFAGLWGLADREGKLEDRPERIGVRIFPFRQVDVEKRLQELADSPEHFIIRYKVGGKRYIYIPTWNLHQHPHREERPSSIPNPNSLEIPCTSPAGSGLLGSGLLGNGLAAQQPASQPAGGDKTGAKDSELAEKQQPSKTRTGGKTGAAVPESAGKKADAQQSRTAGQSGALDQWPLTQAAILGCFSGAGDRSILGVINAARNENPEATDELVAAAVRAKYKPKLQRSCKLFESTVPEYFRQRKRMIPDVAPAANANGTPMSAAEIAADDQEVQTMLRQMDADAKVSRVERFKRQRR